MIWGSELLINHSAPEPDLWPSTQQAWTRLSRWKKIKPRSHRRQGHRKERGTQIREAVSDWGIEGGTKGPSPLKMASSSLLAPLVMQHLGVYSSSGGLLPTSLHCILSGSLEFQAPVPRAKDSTAAVVCTYSLWSGSLIGRLRGTVWCLCLRWQLSRHWTIHPKWT